MTTGQNDGKSPHSAPEERRNIVVLKKRTTRYDTSIHNWIKPPWPMGICQFLELCKVQRTFLAWGFSPDRADSKSVTPSVRPGSLRLEGRHIIDVVLRDMIGDTGSRKLRSYRGSRRQHVFVLVNPPWKLSEEWWPLLRPAIDYLGQTSESTRQRPQSTNAIPYTGSKLEERHVLTKQQAQGR